MPRLGTISSHRVCLSPGTRPVMPPSHSCCQQQITRALSTGPRRCWGGGCTGRSQTAAGCPYTALFPEAWEATPCFRSPFKIWEMWLVRWSKKAGGESLGGAVRQGPGGQACLLSVSPGCLGTSLCCSLSPHWLPRLSGARTGSCRVYPRCGLGDYSTNAPVSFLTCGWLSLVPDLLNWNQNLYF